MHTLLGVSLSATPFCLTLMDLTMAHPIKQQALEDMREAGLDVSVFAHEKVIIEITAVGDVEVHIDFRHRNNSHLKAD